MPEYYMIEIDLIDNPDRYIHHINDDEASLSMTSSHKFSLQELVTDFIESNETFLKKIEMGWDVPNDLDFGHRMYRNQMATEKKPVAWHYKSLIPEKRLQIQAIFSEKGYTISIE